MNFPKIKIPPINNSISELFGFHKIKTEIEIKKLKEIEVLWISSDEQFIHFTQGEIIHGFKYPLLDINKPESAFYIVKKTFVNRDTTKYFTVVKEYNPITFSPTSKKKLINELKEIKLYNEIKDDNGKIIKKEKISDKEINEKQEEIFKRYNIKPTESPDIDDLVLVDDKGRNITPILLKQIGMVKLFESFDRKTGSALFWGIIIGGLLFFIIGMIVGLKM